MKSVYLLPLLALLAACGTPQERCISRNTKDLRIVENLIQEVEGNLARGYAVETYRYTDDVWTRCHARDKEGNIYSYSCVKEIVREDTRPKAIDLKAEAATLVGLRERQTQLQVLAKSVISQCQSLYPETPKT